MAVRASSPRCSLQLDAAVDCYGAAIVNPLPEGCPVKMSPLVGIVKDLSCPLLGLFGEEDQHPSPEEVAVLEKLLVEHRKTYEFHSYPGAGHAFFCADRPSFRPEAAKDGWEQIDHFFRPLPGVLRTAPCALTKPNTSR